MNIKKLLPLLAILSVLVLTLPAVSQGPNLSAGAGKVTASPNVYIVQMVQDPVVAYTGGIRGYRATAPARGQKIDPTNPNVVLYVGYLDARHNAALAAVGGGRKLYDYRYTFNGFAAQLSPAQAEAIKQVPGVVAVTQDEMQEMDTSSTPDVPWPRCPGGLWDQLGGVGNAGEGIIIGLVDCGIWPESLSFSDRTGLNGNGNQGWEAGLPADPGWHGKCTPGEEFNASMCNQKLIGAQYFQ